MKTQQFSKKMQKVVAKSKQMCNNTIDDMKTKHKFRKHNKKGEKK